MPEIETLLYPFFFSNNAVLWHDNLIMIIPPGLIANVDYVPAPGRTAVIFYMMPGEVREYNPETGEIGVEIRSPNVYFEHAHPDWMRWHIDPLVWSFLKSNPYTFLGVATNEKPHRLKIVNNTDKFVYFDLMLWIAEFPSDTIEVDGEEVSIEEALRRYLRGIFKFFYRLGRR